MPSAPAPAPLSVPAAGAGPLTAPGRTLVVAQGHPAADDRNPGTAERPLRSIDAAAQLAQPGDTVLIGPGVYRERVSPARGGEPGRPITYRGAPGHATVLCGSDVFAPAWERLADGLLRAPLAGVAFGSAAYRGRCDEKVYGAFNPYREHFNRALHARPHDGTIAALRERVAKFQEVLLKEDSSGTAKAQDVRKRMAAQQRELDAAEHPTDPKMLSTLGQLFIDGRPLLQVERASDLRAIAGSWMADAEGDALLVHLPDHVADPREHLVELTTRHTVFAPLTRHLGWIALEGLVIQHGANHFPTWGGEGWPQIGILSTRSGHHWTIRDCVVRHARGLGIDIGQEAGREVGLHGENPGQVGESGKDHVNLMDRPKETTGHHLIERSVVCDNGHCGVAGIMSWGVHIRGNRIERNNSEGVCSPWWEFAGIKLHFVFDAVIEGNLVRDNDAHGIWLDNRFAGSRITRNVIVGNRWSGVNVELARGPVTIDHNVIAGTREGDGIYGHDVADVLVAHNLLYGNAGHGAWFAWCTPRIGEKDGCRDIRILNNVIAANHSGAVGLPLDWHCAGDNRSEGNLLMGAGETLDEGSGPFPPRFVVTNKTHCAQFAHICPGPETQTAEVVVRKLKEALAKAGVDAGDLSRWPETFSLPLDLWRAATGWDKDSRTTHVIRDGFATRPLVWTFTVDAAWRDVRCVPLGLPLRDFRGRPLPERPLPGPFQDLAEGPLRLPLWPVAGVPAARDGVAGT